METMTETDIKHYAANVCQTGQQSVVSNSNRLSSWLSVCISHQ